VTTGAIGETVLMEYACVGMPVNLAARICSIAADGEILLDDRVAASLPTDAVLQRGKIALKGLSHPVPVFELKADPGFEAHPTGVRNRSV